MKKEIHIFCAALIFFTRIPFLKGIQVTEEHFSQSGKYFPLVGWIVGGSAALVYTMCSFFLPANIAMLFTLLCSVLLTGSLHEDGLADVCDGFGGGWNKEKILSIMKDSHIGVYGTTGLIFLFLFKFYLLSALFQLHPVSDQLSIFNYPFLIFVAAHAISRFTAITFLFTHNYARANEESKSKLVIQKMSWKVYAIAFVVGIAPLFLFQNIFIFLIIVPLLIVKKVLANYFDKWIEGYTGDCLGTTQQISELVFYLFMLIIPWKYI